LQAKILSSLVNEAHEEMNSAVTLYRPAVTAALFYPMAITYTGLRTGRHFLQVEGHQYDPGVPFSTTVDFEDYSIDPFCKRVETRNFEAHKFTISKAALLESPAFADKVDLIRSLTPIEYGGSDDGNRAMRSEGGASQAMQERVELWNVCIYNGDKIFEGTIPTRTSGTQEWLRFDEYEGPRGGPYDHLFWNIVPGSAMALPPASILRDISEAADETARKMVRGIAKSKKVLGYQPSGKDTAKSLDEARDLSAVKMDDPNAAKVFDLNMMSPELTGFLSWMQQSGNTTAGNPTLVGGTGRIAGTATESEILNSRASSRLLDMSEQVLNMARSHGRKHAWFYQGDPIMEYTVALPMPNGTGGTDLVDIAYTPEQRQGTTPEDFNYECDVTSMAGVDPNMKARKFVEGMTAFQGLIPMIQAGLLTVPGTMRLMQRNMQIDGLDEAIGDPNMIQQNMMADQQAETLNQRSKQATGGGSASPQQGPYQQQARQRGAAQGQAGPALSQG